MHPIQLCVEQRHLFLGHSVSIFFFLSENLKAFTDIRRVPREDLTKLYSNEPANILVIRFAFRYGLVIQLKVEGWPLRGMRGTSLATDASILICSSR